MIAFYTGVGSRRTPPDVLKMMEVIGYSLARTMEWRMILRSGGADGADKAFEKGCDRGRGDKDIYLPWKGFNGHPSALFSVDPDAMRIAAEVYGPRWKRLAEPAKRFHARNVYQVLGQDLKDRSAFLICYTPDGCLSYTTRTRDTGGTGQAIALASYLDIPVYNLFHPSHIERVSDICQVTIKRDSLS